MLIKIIAECLIVCLLLYGGVLAVGASEWPQWRGPDRNGISRETGLLKNLPDGGSQVLWSVSLGEGFSGITVVDGRFYTMFSDAEDEFVVSLDASNGEEIWRFRSDSTFYEYEGGNGPRETPTIDGEFLFTVSAQGKFYALNSVNGEKVWSYDLIKDFRGYMPRWGFSSSPLVEGNKLFVEVEVLWKSERMQNRLALPVLHGNHIYGFHRTILKCIDANTGV